MDPERPITRGNMFLWARRTTQGRRTGAAVTSETDGAREIRLMEEQRDERLLRKIWPCGRNSEFVLASGRPV